MAQSQVQNFLHKIELSGVTAHLPDGDRPGYMLRLLVEESASPGTKEPQWGPSIFVTSEYAESIAEFLPKYFRTQGHLAPEHKGPVQ